MEPGLSQGGFLEEEVRKDGHYREREQLRVRKRGAIQVWQVVQEAGGQAEAEEWGRGWRQWG